jgi:hypothetical protein
VHDVALDSSGEQGRLLTDETDLGSQPLEVQITEVNAVEENTTSEGIVEALNKSNGRRLARSGSTNEGACLAGREGEVDVLDDGYSRTRRVVERDAFKNDLADDLLGLLAL